MGVILQIIGLAVFTALLVVGAVRVIGLFNNRNKGTKRK